jgi:hypothetical protein
MQDSRRPRDEDRWLLRCAEEDDGRGGRVSLRSDNTGFDAVMRRVMGENEDEGDRDRNETHGIAGAHKAIDVN